MVRDTLIEGCTENGRRTLRRRKSKLEILNSTFKQFNGIGVSPVDLSKGITYERKYGGNIFLYKKDNGFP